MTPQPVETGRLYTIPEAAERLAVKESWLRDRVTARLVPHARLGRHVRFTDEHLAQIVAAAEEPTASSIAYTSRKRRGQRKSGAA